jgi:hypothetical protein
VDKRERESGKERERVWKRERECVCGKERESGKERERKMKERERKMARKSTDLVRYLECKDEQEEKPLKVITIS